jgi:hypothetical protein
VRRGLAVLLLAVPLAMANLVSSASPAKSLWVCGWVRTNVFTTTSVAVVTYCKDRFDSACNPGFPWVGPGSVGVADYFVCVDH